MKTDTQLVIDQFPEKEDLYFCLDKLEKTFGRHGMDAITPTDFSIGKFLDLPGPDRLAIFSMIQKYDSILSEHHGEHLSEREIERLRLLRAADEFSMKLVDESIFSCINDGDVIEIYDGTGRQIYRNLMFCKLSSYSLLDVAVNTWQDLYERPTNALQSVYGRTVEVFTTAKTTIPYNVDRHILKERFIYSKRQKVFMMDMKSLCPLINPDTKQTTGAISVAKVELIADSGRAIGII